LIARLSRLSGLDLTSYKKEQMWRRLDYVCRHASVRMASLEEYCAYLERTPHARSDFARLFTINVSSFYRDGDFWRALDAEIGSRFAGRLRPVHCWSCGCAAGQEVYSLAMLLAKHRLLDRATLHATDISLAEMQRARQGGPYVGDDAKELPADLYQRWCRPEPSTDPRMPAGFRVAEELTRKVRFEAYNLTDRKTPTATYDIVLCRNVMIYFTKEMRNGVIATLARTLAPDGLLCIGKTELVWNAADLGLQFLRHGIHARRPGVSSR
jgi:chemotaxis protein methyltransferase CheR